MFNQSKQLTYTNFQDQVEATIIKWICSYRINEKITDLQQLCDGKVFLKILEQLPYFKLDQPIYDLEQSQFQSNLKRLKILYGSLKAYYQRILLKDCSNIIIIDMLQVCSGNKKQIIRIVEMIIGAFMGSIKRTDFLSKIMSMEIKHQEVFMILITNSLKIGEDIEKKSSSSSPNKMVYLLSEMEELEENNRKLQKKYEMQVENSNIIINDLKQQLKQQKNNNKILQQQIKSLKQGQSPIKNYSLELEILQQRLSTQKQFYEKNLLEQVYIIRQLEQKLQIFGYANIQDNQVILNENQLLRNKNENLKMQKDQLIQTLKNKDFQLNQILQKNQDYYNRIIKLQKLNQQYNCTECTFQNKLQFPKLCNPKIKTDQIILRTPYQKTNLNQDLNCIIDNITIENSRMIFQMAQKRIDMQRQYQNLLNQKKQKIEFLQNKINCMMMNACNNNCTSHIQYLMNPNIKCNKIPIDQNNNSYLLNQVNKSIKTQQQFTITRQDIIKFGAELTRKYRSEIQYLIEIILSVSKKQKQTPLQFT